MHESTIIQRALLSVYDKTNIIALAEALHLRGVELISTGNTAKLLAEHGLPVIPVEKYTGFPEMMDGRVKTLHPKIHGGILGRRDIDSDIMLAHNIPDIDLVVVNLYPFQRVSSQKGAVLKEIIENIDIGGPTLLRGAAKNYEWCLPLVDPNDYASFIEVLNKGQGAIDESMRFYFASKAFSHTADYEAHIANFFSKRDNQESNGFGKTLSKQFTLKIPLRYGENPHQKAAFYQENSPPLDSITASLQLQGKELSYNNIADADTALECVKSFSEPACVIVKHANPCGIAIGKSLLHAYDKALACDPISAFGGIIAFNHEVDAGLLQHIFAKQFVEVMIAPGFDPLAKTLASKKENCRLLQYQALHTSNEESDQPFEMRSVKGGVLVQTWDNPGAINFEVVTKRQPTAEELKDLQFAWSCIKYIKSNAIVFAKEGQTLAIGAGQMSRIFSTEIAALKAAQANLSLKGAAMASDAFFPFQDNVEKAHALGATSIVQPGGSKRDQEVIQCANELGISMIFTGIRHFRH